MSPFATAQLLSYLNCAVHVSCLQVNDTLKFLVTLQDEVGNGLPNNLVAIPVTLIILDQNDNAPVFKDVSNYLLFIYCLMVSHVQRNELIENVSMVCYVIFFYSPKNMLCVIQVTVHRGKFL